MWGTKRMNRWCDVKNQILDFSFLLFLALDGNCNTLYKIWYSGCITSIHTWANEDKGKCFLGSAKIRSLRFFPKGKLIIGPQFPNWWQTENYCHSRTLSEVLELMTSLSFVIISIIIFLSNKQEVDVMETNIKTKWLLDLLTTQRFWYSAYPVSKARFGLVFYVEETHTCERQCLSKYWTKSYIPFYHILNSLTFSL